MGGSGGRMIPPSTGAVQRRIEQAREQEQERLDQDVSRILQEYLTRLNDRDADLTRERIESVEDALGEEIEVRELLFGGSVAKHTFVDGLSDVDALAVLNRNTTKGVSPAWLLSKFEKLLSERLRSRDVEHVSVGRMAVTIHYRNGDEVQVLPSVRTRDRVYVPNAEGAGWKPSRPDEFRKRLTKLNAQCNQALVPTIKLAKSLVSGIPEQQRPTGYHVEALALDAVRNYAGPKTPKALLLRVLDHSTERVMKPISDVTGQSRTVDAYLGREGSPKRRLVSQAFDGIGRRLRAATSARQWKAMLEPEGD